VPELRERGPASRKKRNGRLGSVTHATKPTALRRESPKRKKENQPARSPRPAPSVEEPRADEFAEQLHATGRSLRTDWFKLVFITL